MLHNEFEKLTGIQVTDEEFNEINAMYMTANQNFDKESFCKDWKKHKDSTLLQDFYTQVCCFEKQVKELKEEIETTNNILAKASANHHKMLNALKMEMAEFLLKQADIYENKEFARKAIELVGMRMVIKIKLENGYKLFQKDKDYILETMGVLEW